MTIVFIVSNFFTDIFFYTINIVSCMFSFSSYQIAFTVMKRILSHLIAPYRNRDDFDQFWRRKH